MIKKILKFAGISILVVALFPFACVALAVIGIVCMVGEAISYIATAFRDIWREC